MNWHEKALFTLGLASDTVVSLVISLVPINSDAKCQDMSHSRAFKFQAPVLRRRKGKGMNLLSIPLSVSSFPPSDLFLLPVRFIRFRLSSGFWAPLGQDQTSLLGQQACSPQTQLLPDPHPFSAYLFWVWGCLGYERKSIQDF